MRNSRPFLLTLALASAVLAVGCELITAIDPNQLPSHGTGGNGGATTSASTGSGVHASNSSASTGTGTTSSSGGTGGTGGTTSSSGTGAGCIKDADCPQPDPKMMPCELGKCDTTTGSCSMANIPANQPATAQVAGDCKKVVCDGQGAFMSVPDTTDVGDDLNVCTADSCDATGMPVHSPILNAVCSDNGGKVCSSTGACVACNVGADCATGFCKLNKCVTSHCNDQVQDGDETDVDCGGSCTPCADHLKCATGSDCQSALCGPTQTCTPASCVDGKQNEGETDVDCGGQVCGVQGKLCGTGQKCLSGADCQSFDCPAGKCLQATCIDGIQNLDETDVDCGGSTCAARCADHLNCQKASDCQNSICDPGTKTCTPASCTDGVKNGVESDLDCGGAVCVGMGLLCATGQTCKVGADCQSFDCKGGMCQAPTCSDMIKNEGETDVDCGGAACPGSCLTGKMCVTPADCVSGVCAGTCQAPLCTDAVKNGTETDVDCGGGGCPTCAIGKHCMTGADCFEKVCGGPSPTTCLAPTCTDGAQNGAETDVDCGGAVCVGQGKTCADLKKCAANSDCQSGVCTGGVCQAPTCTDATKNGSETDLDCGGAFCDGMAKTCANGLKCVVNADCTSNACDAVTNSCDSNQCIDQHKDGAETDIDCGGGACPGCAVGKVCILTSDCAAGEGCDKTTHKCDANTCNDGVKNGPETDVDCGGTCPGCAVGKICVVTSDCAAGEGCDKITHTCDANTCNDGVKNGPETDVDCGGTCPGCGVGKICVVTNDCAAGEGCDKTTHKCDANTCNDGVKNGPETDVDCGGTCPGCGVGKICVVTGDCAGAEGCDKTTHTCDVNACNDGIKNGAETDVDCGGGTCPGCGVGKVCVATSDCLAGEGCDVTTQRCDANPCNDGAKDGLETDVDCGGLVCDLAGSTCPDGDKCLLNADCANGFCNGAKKCATPTCSDGAMNGTETDVDCGGATCDAALKTCANGKSCLASADCTNGFCNGSGKCATPTCSDGAKNGAETDVDCGGMTCDGAGKTCADGKNCLANADCANGFCNASAKCATPTCSDGAMNGAETDVDCGGLTCDGAGKTCGNGKSCLVNADCTNGFCNGSAKCATPTCSDGAKNGAETDIDCGGMTCDGAGKTCANGKNCLANGDCSNGFCNGSGKCATPSCSDGVRNGTETDVDCGGMTCDGLSKTCGYALGCATNADCASGLCGGALTCECQVNNDCAGVPGNPACDTGTGLCVECTADADCGTNNGKFCDTTSNTCKSCNTAAHCGSTACVACSGSTDTCSAGACKCGSGAACSGSADTCSAGACKCGSGAACSGSADTCSAGACKCGSGPACSGLSDTCAAGTCKCGGAPACGASANACTAGVCKCGMNPACSGGTPTCGGAGMCM